MVHNDLVRQLQQHFQMQMGGGGEGVGRAFRNLWWVQDGAPAHRLIAVSDHLRELFGHRVIATWNGHRDPLTLLLVTSFFGDT